ERAVLPRTKACGGGLSPWTIDLLDELGVGDQVRSEMFRIRSGRVAGSRGDGVEVASNVECGVLLRSRFDQLLVQEAVRRGVQLIEGTTVQRLVRQAGRLVGLETEHGFIHADAAIVANGAKSKLTAVRRPGRVLNAIMGWYADVDRVHDSVELY